MQCHSCGGLVASAGDARCSACRGDAGESTDTDRVLLPDGGHEPGNEGDGTEDDGNEETYLEPDEIIGNDIDDEPAEADDATDQQSGGSPDTEPEATDGSQQPAQEGEPETDAGGDEQDAPPAATGVGESREPGDDRSSARSQPPDDHEQTASNSQAGSQPDPHGSHQAQSEQAAGSHQHGSQAEQQHGGTGGQLPQGQTGGRQGQAGSRQGQPTGRGGHQRSQGAPVERIQEFPLKLGATLGAVAFLVLYFLITIAAYWAYEESPLADPEMGPFDVGAEVFLTVVGLGSGERVVDFFIGMADVDVRSPGEVDSSNYPTVEDQLGPLLSLLDSTPEVPLLVVYLVVPYALFVSGRYLARHYAPSKSALDRTLAGATVALGTLPVVLVVGAAFETFALLERIVFVGLVLPAGFGALGGLSIRFFDEHSAIVSTLFGWGTIAAGIVVAALLLPMPDLGLGEGASLDLSLLDRLVLGIGIYLNTLEFNVGTHLQGRLLFVLIAAITVVAGFLRTWRVDEPIEHRMDGARVGASIWLGFVATVAVFLWLFPMSTVLVDVTLTGDLFSLVAGIEGDAVEGAGGVTLSTVEAVVGVDSFFHTIAVAGFIFPAMFGGIGGYLAVWYDERR